MKPKGYKRTRCEKKSMSKCTDSVARTYNAIEAKYAERLEENTDVKEFQCQVLLEGLEIGEYCSDFVATKMDDELMVREEKTVFRYTEQYGGRICGGVGIYGTCPADRCYTLRYLKDKKLVTVKRTQGYFVNDDGAYIQQMREKEGSRLVWNLYRSLHDLGMTDLEIEGLFNKEVNC